MGIEKFDWKYDEMQHVGTDYNDIKEIEKYDLRMSKFRDFEEENKTILNFLNLNENDNIIEFGCGTGQFTIEASKNCNNVRAVDISQMMLNYIEDKASFDKIKNIELVNSGFLNYEHNGEKLTAVVSQLALHHLPDFWKIVALKKIFDLLEVGGKFFLRDVVFSIPLDKYNQKIDGFLNWTEESAGKENADNYARHIKQEYSTFDWIMEEMLYRAGFYIEKAEYDDSFIGTYLCVKPKSLDF